MTDDPIPPSTPTPPAAPSGNGVASNGVSPVQKPTVRSGLAKRRNPALATAGSLLSGTRRILLRDPLSVFLLLASIGLAIAFASLLGADQAEQFGRAGSPQHRPDAQQGQSHLDRRAARPRQPRGADHHPHRACDRRRRRPRHPRAQSERGDRRHRHRSARWVRPASVDGLSRFRCAHAAAAARLAAGGAVVSVDQQSGKPTKAIVVQFLIPILLLVCLFSLFTRLGGEGQRAASPPSRSSPARAARRARARPTGSPSPTWPERGRRSRSSARFATTWPIRASTSRSARRRPRACCSWALRGRARRCSPRRWRAKRTPRSSRCPVRTSSSRW